MKNATYVDQCDTIRILTEEEMAVVSGGMFLPPPYWSPHRRLLAWQRFIKFETRHGHFINA